MKGEMPRRCPETIGVLFKVTRVWLPRDPPNVFPTLPCFGALFSPFLTELLVRKPAPLPNAETRHTITKSNQMRSYADESQTERPLAVSSTRPQDTEHSLEILCEQNKGMRNLPGNLP